MARKKRNTDVLAPSSAKNTSSAPSQSLHAQSDAVPPPKKRKTAPAEIPTLTRRHTRGMTTDAARKAVFNTSELLESILVFLPPKTLFGVQRVSKQFQAIIATSIPIQEKMFLRIRNKPQPSWRMSTTGFDTFFVETANICPGLFYHKPTELNPFLELQNPRESCADRASMSHEITMLILNKPVSLVTPTTGVPSIFNTYISDPPSEQVFVSYQYLFPPGYVSVSRLMYGENRGDGTIGGVLRQALEGDGRAYTSVVSNDVTEELAWEKDTWDKLCHPRRVVEHCEKMLDTTAIKGGIKVVEIDFQDMVVPTHAERAAVQSRVTKG